MFDSHAHVSFRQFDDDREAVISRAREAGVVGWLEVGTDLEQSRRAVVLARTQEGVFASVGVHPSEVDQIDEQVFSSLEQLLDQESVVAVGEIGLDYYRGGTKQQQLPALERLVQLAGKKSLPVVFHVRDGEREKAHDDLIAYLGSLDTDQRPRGVIHTFSGSLDQAKQYLELGFYLAFSGVVTFKNAGELPAVVALAPLDRILIETDCPFLAPEPYRGQRNEPAYVRQVAEKLAAIRDVAMAEILAATTKNATELFRLNS
ncbi:TatD family hydrolase [Patescibacteria group bacterium]|nr:TatD family hydrolase [Patescibacteria group bacterium]